jgi:hypothetical protein
VKSRMSSVWLCERSGAHRFPFDRDSVAKDVIQWLVQYGGLTYEIGRENVAPFFERKASGDWHNRAGYDAQQVAPAKDKGKGKSNPFPSAGPPKSTEELRLAATIADKSLPPSDKALKNRVGIGGKIPPPVKVKNIVPVSLAPLPPNATAEDIADRIRIRYNPPPKAGSSKLADRIGTAKAPLNAEAGPSSIASRLGPPPSEAGPSGASGSAPAPKAQPSEEAAGPSNSQHNSGVPAADYPALPVEDDEELRDHGTAMDLDKDPLEDLEGPGFECDHPL